MDDLTELDLATAGELLQRLVDQLGSARQTIEAAQRRVAGFRKMVDALVEMFPELEDRLPEDLDEDEPSRPRGAMAVYEILQENLNSWYQVGAVVRLLQEKEWMPQSSNPANAVRSALERLHDTGSIEKSRSTAGAVIYRVHEPEEEPF
jgi:hypothetical protein